MRDVGAAVNVTPCDFCCARASHGTEEIGLLQDPQSVPFS